MARDGKKTKDKILTQTKDLVYGHGFSGTSIDQILDKTGITKGAFFYHFKSKNALAKALIEEYAREDMSHLDYALKETEPLKKDPLNRLLQFIQLYIDMMLDLKEPPSCLYASFTYEQNQFEHDVLTLVSDTIIIWRNTFCELLKNVLADYTVNKEVDIPSLADQFTVIFEGAFVISKALNEVDLTAKQLQHFKNYLELLFEPKT